MLEVAAPRQRRANRKMLYLLEQYKVAHPDECEEVSPHLVAPWAIKQGLWKRPPIEPEEILRRLMCRALREDYMEDPQHRGVRRHHPVIVEVKTSQGTKRYSTWYEIYEMPPEKMRGSLQLRRRAALYDVQQLKFDFDSYNDNNKFAATLPPMDFDFNKDLAEMAEPTIYSDQAPDGDSDDESEEDIIL